MRVPISWLKDYVDIDVDVKKFADEMTMSGSKVETIEVQGREITGVVTAKVLKIEKHPNADRLHVAQVDTGKGITQVVTGADNVREGDCIPVALDGATLPGGKRISAGKLRGVDSCGMMCSAQELGITPGDFPGAVEDGIFILDPETPVGKDIKDVLGMNETVVEFEITPNRPDCLSIIGIAREAAATFGKKLKYPQLEVCETKGDRAEKYASVEILDAELCPRYAARVVKNVKIEESPEWMKRRLRAAGMRPINNIVDITNYVMLEFGQPMHAFDIENIADRKIIVRRAKKGEKIDTLDEKKRTLDEDMLVIADGKRPIAIAGVIGGADSEIRESTKTILFESANFNGTSVRITSGKLGVRTEASSRFEKGLDPNMAMKALDRAAQLINMLGAGDAAEGVIDCYPHRTEERTVKFDYARINGLLGTNLTENEIVKILESLELTVDTEKKEVAIPTFRGDIETDADLAEEVARFYGYNRIKPTLLEGKATTIGRKTRKQIFEDIIVNTMLSAGLSEAYTFSFMSPEEFDKIRLPANSEERKAVVVKNPLSKEQSLMRTTTIPAMLASLSTNYSRKVKQAKLFEFSHVYLPDQAAKDGLPVQKKVLTMGMYGNVDFYDLKGVVEMLMASLRVKDGYKLEKSAKNPIFHPGRTGTIIVNGKKIGTIGEIHPEVIENYELPERVYIGVIEAEHLIENAIMHSKYVPLPKFPPVERDIALIVKDDVSVKSIEDVIRNESGSLLEDMELFDIYKGKQVPDGCKSVAYSITFRAGDRTLTDEEVNSVMGRIIETLHDELGAILRK